MLNWTKLARVGIQCKAIVAAAFNDKVGVIKIDVDKDQELVEAYHVKSWPILMIYKEGSIKLSQSGGRDADTIIGLINEFV